MASAPAGWYRDTSAPGGQRYWNGTGWLDALPAQATGPVDFSPQATVFTPAAADVTAEVFQPASVDHFTDTPPRAEPVVQPMAIESFAAVEQKQVPWDVVGVARQPDASAPSRLSTPEWSPATQSAYQQAPFAYGAGSTLPYGSSASPSRRWSGRSKVLATIASVLVAFGLRWAFSLFFGGDFSTDGRIEVEAPDHWTTYTSTNPDITYAMDARWMDVKSMVNKGAIGTGARAVETRLISTDSNGHEAVLILGTTSFSIPGAKASREDFEGALNKGLKAMTPAGAGNVTNQTFNVLSSDAGDRWGFRTAHYTFQGVGLTDYAAVAIIDSYAVVVQLLVPDGSALTKNDILAVVNSIESR